MLIKPLRLTIEANFSRRDGGYRTSVSVRQRGGHLWRRPVRPVDLTARRCRRGSPPPLARRLCGFPWPHPQARARRGAHTPRAADARQPHLQPHFVAAARRRAGVGGSGGRDTLAASQ